MTDWSFLTNHGRAILCIASDPGVRLRDIADRLEITERTAFGIVNDLSAAGYVTKERDGRRNRYTIHEHLPVREAVGRSLTIGEVLDLFVDTAAR
jgi:DNA-binding MarR family transcriptional regulator